MTGEPSYIIPGRRDIARRVRSADGPAVVIPHKTSGKASSCGDIARGKRISNGAVDHSSDESRRVLDNSIRVHRGIGR